MSVDADRRINVRRLFSKVQPRLVRRVVLSQHGRHDLLGDFNDAAMPSFEFEDLRTYLDQAPLPRQR